MEAQALVQIAQLRGEYFMADWFAKVKIDNKPAFPSDLLPACRVRFLSALATTACLKCYRNPSKRAE